jgi:hypothetical protein
MFYCNTKYYLLWVNSLWIALCHTVDALWVLSVWTVKDFIVNCTTWQGCGWAGGHGASLEAIPLGVLPLSARSTRPWMLGHTKSARGALATTPTGNRPSAACRLISFLLGAIQASHGAWAAYTFSIIVLKIYFF